jgi:hypothetical protein
MKYTAPRIIAGVTRRLFLDRAPAFYQAFMEGEHHERDALRAETT